jgi:hypothetical protein
MFGRAAALVALLARESPAFAISAVTDANTTLRGPGNYYASIDTTLNGAAFRAELTGLIVDHKVLSYNDLWSVFPKSDQNTGQPNGCQQGQVGDVYSYKCWDAPAEQCGNYQQEGDCYNR